MFHSNITHTLTFLCSKQIPHQIQDHNYPERILLSAEIEWALHC